MDKAILTWWHLNVLNRERYEAVLGVYGDLQTALTRMGPELLQALGCRNDSIEKTLARLEEFDVEAFAKELQKRGVNLVSLQDANYPARLQEIGDPPVFLSYKGDLTILDQPTIALVGTRKMSAYGKRVTDEFTPAFVRAGMTTVSGLALGIDARVAEETLRAGGKTVAVLGHGLGSIYPQSNARLAEKIVESGGLLLSEFPLSMTPEKYMFPARNRIIAGLSLGTVVLEAPEESGAIITAELALDYSREVFAVPGQIFDENYRGCHRLIKKNQAHLVQTPEEVLRELGLHVSEEVPSLFQSTDPQEQKLYTLLSSMPQSLDDLTEKSGQTAGELNALLTMMELAGGVKNVGGGLWVRR